jgi:hypothetical protein
MDRRQDGSKDYRKIEVDVRGRNPASAQTSPTLGLLFGDDHFPVRRSLFGKPAGIAIGRIDFVKPVKLCAQALGVQPVFNVMELKGRSFHGAVDKRYLGNRRYGVSSWGFRVNAKLETNLASRP